jgi:hypothetical protein
MDTSFLIFKGETWRNCGASGGQKAALKSDQAFQQVMSSDYSTTFGENQEMMKNLSGNLNEIIGAGSGQQGFSADELAAMNSQNINAAAASNQKIQTAIGENAASHGSATPGVESGVVQAEKAAAQTSVDTNMNNQAANITQANYATGRQNYWSAVGEDEKLPSAFESPSAQFASGVNAANENVNTQANANEAANNSWQGLVTGLAGDAASAYSSYTKSQNQG